jgi:DNA polymerase-3 subunit delta'
VSSASDPFAEVSEQEEAKTLLRTALIEGAAHAYLFHGPAGVGKRRIAVLFAAELLGDLRRCEQRSHPDLLVLEPVGDQIRIDDVRALRHDLHMRPFEATRRVYLIFSAETMNREASDALLKDLEEPPSYAVFVLVADEPAPISETIRSRCQPVSFHRLSEHAIYEQIVQRGGVQGEERMRTLARIAAGRLDRVERLLEPDAAARRERLLTVARAAYSDPDFDPAGSARLLKESIEQRGAEARAREEHVLEEAELTKRELDQRLRRVQRGAERDELLAMLEELAAWYRDLVAVAVGADAVLIHADRAADLRAEGSLERLAAAEEAVEAVRAAFRCMQALNLNTTLALEALLVRLHALFVGVEALV